MVVILYLFVSGKLPLSLPFLVTWDGGFLNTYHLFSSGPPSDSQIYSFTTQFYRLNMRPVGDEQSLVIGRRVKCCLHVFSKNK